METVTEFDFNPNDYKPHVIEGLQYKYAQTIVSEKDTDNLEWALKFMKDYERKHPNARTSLR